MFSLTEPPLFTRLKHARRVLIAGAGGGIDAIVLVDGGTDILMRGDETGLGTPEEDMTSLAAVHGLEFTGSTPERLVACLGFGIDAYHDVNHASVLENIAALDRDGAYLGAFSIPRDSPEGGRLPRRARAAQPLPGPTWSAQRSSGRSARSSRTSGTAWTTTARPASSPLNSWPKLTGPYAR